MARTVKKKRELTIEEKLAEALIPVEEQPHPINNNWKWLRLNALCNDIIVPQRDKPKSFGGNIPWCRIEDIEGKFLNGTLSGQYVTEETINKMNLRVCPSGTVICSCSASLGRQAILTTACCTNQTFIGLVCHSLLYHEYLYYYLMSLEDYWHLIGTGTTIKYISRKKFELLPVPLPPLPEQQRIVDRIESLFAKLDEAKEKAQAVVDGFEDCKAAILHKAFSGELTGGWRETVGKSISEWRTVTVGEISDVKGGKRVPKGMSLTDTDTGHPYIKAGNLKQGTVIDNGISYVPDEVLPYIKNYTVTAGDVYITNVGACIGDCGVIPSQFDGANLTENAVKMTNLQCVSEYLAWYLSSSSVQQLIKTLIASATLGKLSIANIKTIPVYLPSNEEQLKIIETISQLLEKEQQAKEAAEQVISQIDIMKKSILARAFRGELGTNDPADESAVELLKRIL